MEQPPGQVVHVPGQNTVVERVVTKDGPVQIQRVVEKEVVEVEKIVEKEKVVEKVVVQEKIVNVLNAEGEALTEYNAALVNQRAQLGEQLEGQKAMAAKAQSDVSAVMAKLAALQSRVCGSSLKRGEAADDQAFEEALKRKKEKEKRIKKRLEKKRRAAQAAEEGRLAAEAEREAVELELQEAALEMDEREREFRREKKKLKRKILQGQNEIEDLHDEFQREREMLQDNVREANRDAQLWRQVCELVLDKNLVDRVWQRSEYDPREDKWILPEMLRAKRQYQDLSCPPLPGMGPTPPVQEGVFDRSPRARPASRSPRAVMGLAGAARPPSQQPGVGGLAGAARPPSYSPRLDDFMDAPREEYSRPSSNAIPSRPTSSRPGSTRPHSRPLSRAGGSRGGDQPRRRRKEKKREKSRENPGGLAGAAVGGLAAAAVGGLAGAAQVGGLAAAASKPPSQKPPRPKKKAVGGLAGAAVGGLAGAAQRPVGGLAGAAASYDYDIASP